MACGTSLGSCYYGCTGACATNSCSGVCSLTCEACSKQCSSSCTTGCGGTCKNGCSSCTGTCEGCSGSCKGSCVNTCKGTCSGGCSDGCANGCTGTCLGMCNQGCSSNSMNIILTQKFEADNISEIADLILAEVYRRPDIVTLPVDTSGIDFQNRKITAEDINNLAFNLDLTNYPVEQEINQRGLAMRSIAREIIAKLMEANEEFIGLV